MNTRDVRLQTVQLLGIGMLIGCGSNDPPKVEAPFGKFEGRVVAEWSDDDSNMTLVEDFAYIEPNGKRWTAPKGAIVNGASIPQSLWSVVGGPFEGPFRNASVVHDVGCDEQAESWEDVHRMFHDACRCGGVSSQKAKMLYWAVYNFGPRWAAPGEPRLFGLKAAPSPMIDEEMVLRAEKYFEEHDPSLDEIESLSVEGGALELDAYSSSDLSNEAAN
jgi:hypothetical protein